MTAALSPHQTELEVLCRRYNVKRLELFGSKARGQARAGKSDLDFLVEFGVFPPGDYADAYFRRLESLTTARLKKE
jgi:predicted nucleotidyltransferase